MISSWTNKFAMWIAKHYDSTFIIVNIWLLFDLFVLFDFIEWLILSMS